ncbi:MAG: hypothetical protein PHE70_03215 [Tepidanaerobacteraceae bacterium]|nr:hypothetical protein [Tepidanaerobacteraceae bacterium]
MKFLRKYRVVLIVFGLLVLCNIAYAADALYRFMHNDHDALIIGEITHMDETGAKVKIAKGIVSAKNLNKNHPKKQLKLSEAKILMPFSYQGFYNEDGSCTVDPCVGDHVLLSLKKDGNNFKVAWGAYKVDSLDYEILSIILPENSRLWSRMEAAAIKAFINSDGQITEFAFDRDSKTVYAGEEKVVIFKENTDEGENTLQDEEKIKESIIGRADGPTSIYVSGNPIKAMINPMVAVLIFVGGFAVGYIVKSRRSK